MELERQEAEDERLFEQEIALQNKLSVRSEHDNVRTQQQTTREPVKMPFGEIDHGTFVDGSKFGVGFDVDEVCGELRQRGYHDVRRMRSEEAKVPRNSVAYRGRAIVFYDTDTLKVTHVETHGCR